MTSLFAERQRNSRVRIRCVLVVVLLALHPLEPQAETVLRAGTLHELEPLSPAADGFWYLTGYMGFLHMPLTTFRTPDAAFGPCLARSWRVADDNRSVTFELAQGAQWHDGRPVTADDAAFTLEYLKTHQLIGQLWRFLERAEALDPHHLKVTFTEAVAYYQWMFFPWPKILPRHIWEPVAEPGSFQGRAAMVGCGPFAFDGYDAGAQEVTLRRRPGFFDGEPVADVMKVRHYGSPSALVLALRKGDIDVVMGHDIPEAFAAGVKGEGVETTDVADTGVPLTLVFHYSNPPTHRLGFREAVAHAVDPEALIRSVLHGRGRVAERGFLPPEAWAYGGPFPRLTHDPARADALLDSMGFRDRDGDGYREDDAGEAMTLHLVPETWHSQGETLRACELVIQHLRQVGIRAQMRKLVEDAELDALWEKRDYQAYVGYATDTGARDGGHVYFADYRDFSYGSWKDSAYFAILDRLTHAPDRERYLEAARASQAFAARELPGLALAWGTKTFAHRSDRFTGWEPMPGFGYPNYDSWFRIQAVEPPEEAASTSSPLAWIAGGLLLLGAVLMLRPRRERA